MSSNVDRKMAGTHGHVYLVMGGIATFVLIAASLPALFAETMYVDDFARYVFALEDRFPWYLAERNFLAPFFRYPLFELMTIDVGLARLAQVIVYMVPLSIAFFYLLNGLLGVNRFLAAGAALWPGLLPGQDMVPFFIDGSYVVQGLLFFVLALIGALHAVADPARRLLWAAVCIVCLLVSAGLMEHVAFITPAAVLLFFAWRPLNWKAFLVLAFLFTVVAAWKLWFLVNAPVSAAARADIGIEMIQSRAWNFLAFSTPLPNMMGDFWPSGRFWAGSALALLVLAGFVISIRRTGMLDYPGEGYRVAPWVIMLVMCVWAVGSIGPFIVASPFYSSRYAFIPAFGVGFVVLGALFTLAKAIGGTRVASLLVVVFIVSTGILRIFEHTHEYGAADRRFLSVKNSVATRDYPERTQIVTVPHLVPTGGWYHYSSGLYKYMLGRGDVDGLHGNEEPFHNAFDPEEKGFSVRMSGLDLHRPTFLFKRIDGEFVQIDHALQWKEDDNWTIFRFDTDTGDAEDVFRGSGLDTYVEAMNRLAEAGIAREKIMWAGSADSYPSRSEP